MYKYNPMATHRPRAIQQKTNTLVSILRSLAHIPYPITQPITMLHNPNPTENAETEF
jgi:hypothetical protein